ncbi:hypothetical protein [Polaromonas glacialis]|uniref:hypothetical protein n=1 Tax=Polaromonas glacialis TaxID=866564 RepID=UPI0012EBD278|nr:hypothetical protein [Polaromonas glacialis]
MTEKSLFSSHGIKDNHTRGKVADFLEQSQLNWGYYEVQPQMLESLPIPAASNEQIAVIECILETITAGTRRPDYERLPQRPGL